MTRFAPAFETPAGSPIRELFPYLGRPGMISLAGGYPSPALFDVKGLSEATQRVMAKGGACLQYGATEGSPALRGALKQLSQQRGLTVEDRQMLVTTGSQQAFDLLVRVLVKPGDVVLLEAPAYPAAIQALRLAGATMVEIPMDSQGLQTDALARTLESWTLGERPRLLYTVPTFSNPHGSLLGAARRERLVELAHRHALIVVEDDPYGELSFEGEVPLPVHAFGTRRYGRDNPVIYLSSLSKTVAPALRVGWMLAPEDIVHRCTIAKQTADLCTSPWTQLVAASYLDAGRYAGTVRSAREEYGRRVRALSQALKEAFGPAIRFQTPAGGMFLWVECAIPVDAARLFEAAVAQGVLFVPGAAFHLTAPHATCMRLSFASASVDDIREGVRRLRAAFRSAALQ